MSTGLASNVSYGGKPSFPPGGLGACHQQVKKGLTPALRRSFFEDIDINVHTCMNKTTLNPPQHTSKEPRTKNATNHKNKRNNTSLKNMTTKYLSSQTNNFNQ